MVTISRAYRKILAALLTCLGFTGVVCGVDQPVYGVPSATFKAKGIVVCETKGTPIEGIHVTLEEKHQYSSEEQSYEIGSTHTGNNGVFNVEGESIQVKRILYVKLTDVDGEENGLYAGEVIEADFRNVTFKGGSGNQHGSEAEIDLGTIKMKPDGQTGSE